MVSRVPELALVRGDEGLVVGERVDVDRLAVDVDEGHAAAGGGVRHRLGRRGVDGVDDDRVDARGDEVVDLVELLRDVVLGVLDLYLDAVERARVLDEAVAEHGQEVVVEARHRHPDGLGHGGRRQERQETGSGKGSFHSRFLL